jgi:hypothetical protein
MTNIAEWIAMGVVVAAATAFTSYLVYLKAAAVGHPKRDIWRGLIMVWLGLVAAVVVLAGARAIVGGPIISYSSYQGGLRLSWDRPVAIYTTISALILVGIVLYLALRNVRRLQEPPKSGPDDHDCANSNSQQHTTQV